MPDVQPVTTDSTTTPPPATTDPNAAVQKPADMVSDKFAALAKKDKIVSKRAQDIAAHEKSVKDREEKIAKREAELDRIRTLAETDPEAAAKEIGLQYERWTESILNKGKVSPDTRIEMLEKMLQKRLDTVENKIKEDKERAEKEAKDAASKQSQQVIDNYKGSISEFVTSKADEYALLNKMQEKGLINVSELIFQGVQMVYKDKGAIPTIKEAADGVQAYFVKEIEALIDSVKYFKDKYGSKEAVTTPDGATPTTTISNDMSPGMGTNLPAATEEERIKRALAAMAAVEK